MDDGRTPTQSCIVGTRYIASVNDIIFQNPMTISYRRIPAHTLTDLIERQDEEATVAYFYQDRVPFPYSLHNYDLGEYWPLLRDFLDIEDNPTSVFWRLIKGSRPVVPFPYWADQEYLGVVDYLSPAEVQTISRAMAEITREESIKRYMAWRNIEDETAVWEEDPLNYTGYRFVYDLFRDFFCFIHIAEEAGDGILRLYSG